MITLRLLISLILILSLLSLDGWAQGNVSMRAKAGKPLQSARSKTPVKPAPAPAAKPASPPKKKPNDSFRIKTDITVDMQPRPLPPVLPEEPQPEAAQKEEIRWHLAEMSFQWLMTTSWNSASGSGSAAFTDNFGSGLRTTVGPNIDLYFFQDRYAFGTGLWYTIKRMGYSHPPDRVLNPGTLIKTSAFNLQYLQVPLTMKLMSNTLFRTGRAFVQYGGTMDFKLAETAIDYENNYLRQRDGNIDQFSSAGLSLLLAVGYMHRVSHTNDLMMTMQYQRSLTNNAIPDNLWAISQHFAFGIGLSF